MRRNWTDKLSERELDHLVKDAGVETLQAFRAMRQKQHEIDPVDGMCRDCKFIAHKLGLE
jgi:hypothetical protein